MTAQQQDLFMRMAHAVGDFGHPFYDEERQRDVWNEASAFGLQLLLWTSLSAAAVTVWVVGAAAAPYACGAVALVGLVSALTIAYAQRLGVTLTGVRVLRWRLLPYLGLVAALLLGVLRSGATEWSSSFAQGLLAGAVVGLLLVVVAVRRSARV